MLPVVNCSRRRWGALTWTILFGVSACRVRESPEDARAKAQKQFLETQVASLQELVGRAERGELATADRIAIGVQESVARAVLNGPLPLEQVIAGRFRIRVEHAEPIFRGNKAALVFRARLMSEDLPNQYADIELAGLLQDLKLVDGRLAGRVELAHFTVTKASVGSLAQGLVENLMRANLAIVQKVLPPFQVPVRLEQQLRIGRFDKGPVSARGGELPLTIQLGEVLAVNQRLWALIDAKAGPWKPAAAEAAP
jgi:hypothetical protein